MVTSTDEKIALLKSKVPDATEDILLELLVSCNGSINKTLRSLGILPDKSTLVSQQATLKRYLPEDKQESPGSSSEAGKQKKIPKLDVKGQTIHLYDPDQIKELNIPCTLILNVFDPDLANDLLRFLMKDSEDWKKLNFYMFERQVSSHHTSAVFSDNTSLLERQDATYNGKKLRNIRKFHPTMVAARDVVQRITNEEIKRRGLARYQYPHTWECDVAICNRYDGPRESVGYHSDQMTHIGPHSVISSVSLGATREFRLKDRHDREKSTISIHLPHNSLLIMHAGCQEEYKHSLVPVTYELNAHPISGHSRLNLTYRMYLDEFKSENLPRCSCDKPMLLRTTIAPSAKERNYKYIWQCGGGYTSEKGGCGTLIYPRFRANPVD